MVEDFIIRIKRQENSFYAVLKRMGKAALRLHAPYPGFVLPAFRGAHYSFMFLREGWERVMVALYRYPVLRSLCEHIGPGLEMEFIPGIAGPVKVWIGDQVRLSGRISIVGARVFNEPRFIVKNRVFIGNGVSFSLAKEIVIEDDVLIAGGCMISDYSGHPVDPRVRASGVQVPEEEVRPVRICRNAWIGKRAVILPGVTIGEGAIVGAAAVVTKDVPPFHVCVGNPGRNIARQEWAASPEHIL